MPIEYGSWIVAALFILRLLIPLAVLLALGYLYERFTNRGGGAKTASPTDEGGILHLAGADQLVSLPALEQPCWEIRGCPADQRAACPVMQRPSIPCWLTMQLIEGKLPDRCVGCAVFKGSSSHQSIPVH